MSRSSVVVLVAALAIFAGFASRACACSCVFSDFYSAFARSHAVFLGEVLEISSPSPERPYEVAVTLRVENAWKGAPAPSTIRVLTASSGVSCGYSFQVGSRYLVYASRWDASPVPEELWTSLCSRTHEAWVGDPDIELLNSEIPTLHLTMGPNPSLGSVRLEWTIVSESTRRAHARLEIFDYQGRRVRTLFDGAADVGGHQSFWDGRDGNGELASAGVYWIRLAYGDHVLRRKLVRIAARP